MMRRKGIPSNSTCVNAAMHGFARLRQWKRAVEVLLSMGADYGVAPDAVGVFFSLLFSELATGTLYGGVWISDIERE